MRRSSESRVLRSLLLALARLQEHLVQPPEPSPSEKHSERELHWEV